VSWVACSAYYCKKVGQLDYYVPEGWRRHKQYCDKLLYSQYRGTGTENITKSD